MPGPILCAHAGAWDPLSRSYGVSLPSSLTMSRSSALVSSTRPPVSVCGTGRLAICLAGFLGSMVTTAVASAGASAYCPVLSRAVCLTAARITTRFNALFRQRAGVSLLRRRIARKTGAGILTGCPSGAPCGSPLRSRLTLIRLALIRNPGSFGVGVSRPHCRYLYLHLLFPELQNGSRRAFGVTGMLPYQCPIIGHSTVSAAGLCPIIIHAGPLD